MTSTPSSRPKPTPSSSPFPHRSRPARSPHRGRPPPASDTRLSLKRVVGTTCVSPTGFDAVQSSFAYIAGGAVVVVDVDREEYSQRFFRARPTALPVYNTQAFPYSPSTPTSTPKANDSRNRVSLRESSYDWSDSPASKTTWTSRERIKAATCLALSKDARFLAVGETGYSPRVLIYSLEDHSSDTPLVSISEHVHGVKAVAWSFDTRYLASLGSANDGFLYIWKVEPKTGAAVLFQQNRCTSYVRGMVWVGNNLVTLGVRHIKVWRIDEAQATSPTKQKLMPDPSIAAQPQKTLPGRNVILGNMIEATFSCAAAIDDTRAIICSEAGDVCLFDDTDKQIKLTLVLESGLAITCVAIHEGIAYLGGKSGGFLAIDLAAFLECDSDCLQTGAESSMTTGLFSLGFLKENMVMVDAKSSIHIMKLDGLPVKVNAESSMIPIPGHRDAVQGVEGLSRPNAADADFFSWSASGEVVLWDVDGRIKSSFRVPLEDAYYDDELGLVNQMTTIRATQGCNFFVTGDKHGIIRIVDFVTKECVSTMKAHSSDCKFITTFEDKTTFLIASCGRDRTAQLFHKTAGGGFEHFQTLEFSARVTQVLIPSADKFITCSLDRTLQIHDLVTKEGDPDARAAITSKSLALKASPSSMAMSPDGKSVFVSLLDRSICVFNVEKRKPLISFKCLDESGIESVALDSLVIRPATDTEPAFLLGVSNTDKSIRIYDAQTGLFLDREWGHTEAINGVAMVGEDDTNRTIASVGSDGTIMIWEMDLQDRPRGSSNREPSPTGDAPAAARPTLRRVLSKTELVEFQRSTPSGGRRSPSRTVAKKRSLFNLSTTMSVKSPYSTHQSSPVSAVAEERSSRRPSTTGSQSGSPPDSPKARGVTKRPSLQGLNSARTKSNSNLRAAGTLTTATEQTCRSLRAYRKKLASSDSINPDVLAELDQELRLTAVALGDRAARSQLMADTMNSLLDQYSERLVSLLDEKLRLNCRVVIDQDSDYPVRRPGSSGTGSSSGTA